MSHSNRRCWLTRHGPSSLARRRAAKPRRSRLWSIEALEYRTLLSITVETQAASSVSATGATLTGSVNPQGQNATVMFQYSTDPGFAPTVQATRGSGLSEPTGVAVDAAGDVFVADSVNGAVEEILPDGTIRTLGYGFKDPRGVAVDARGDVFVADYGNRAVKEISVDGGMVRTLGTGISQPAGVAVDAKGDVFVADDGNGAVEEILPGGATLTLGTGFSQPAAVAVDAAGDVFVADYGHDAVKEIPAGGGAMRTRGYGFSEPRGVAVDAAGDVFVADYGHNALKEILPDGTIRTRGSGFNDPVGVAVDALGDAFVADYRNNRVVELSPPSLPAASATVSGSTTMAVSTDVTGLTPGTTYYYRAVAVSAGGDVAGATKEFATPRAIAFLAGVPGDGAPQTFVHNLYRELLGRETDSAGDSFWSSYLAGHNNAAGQAQAIQTFLNSQEYATHYVTALYQIILGRAPDAGGLQFWASKMGSPGTPGGAAGSADEKAIVAAFFGSDEFYSKAGNTAQGAINALYEDILGRAPDPSGAAFWAHELATRGAGDRDGVVRDLLTTPEAAHLVLDRFYPAAGGTSSHPLPVPGAPAGAGSTALAMITGDGWENLYLQGPYDSQPQGNDSFFNALAAGAGWDEIQLFLLDTGQFYANPSRPITN